MPASKNESWRRSSASSLSGTRLRMKLRSLGRSDQARAAFEWVYRQDPTYLDVADLLAKCSHFLLLAGPQTVELFGHFFRRSDDVTANTHIEVAKRGSERIGSRRSLGRCRNGRQRKQRDGEEFHCHLIAQWRDGEPVTASQIT